MDFVKTMHLPRPARPFFHKHSGFARGVARIVARCLALLLIASNFAAAGVPVGNPLSHARPASASALHHHCDDKVGAKIAHARRAGGCSCCDGQGCQCLHASAALCLPWRPFAAKMQPAAGFELRATSPASRNVSPRLRPPIA
ncbi:MAG: hypothetical protein ABI846_04230 [Rudaea sp.]